MKSLFRPLLWFCSALPLFASSSELWSRVSPRAELRPEFEQTEKGGKSGQGALIIRADEREGLHGWWQRNFSVTPGQHYQFSAWRRAERVTVPRRSVIARVLWRDTAGKPVKAAEGVV